MTDTFARWYEELDDLDRPSVLAGLLVLREKGPTLSRPFADTIQGSRFNNMKELRIQSKGKPIRAFFVFDPDRKGILLCAGSKSGNDKAFYKKMIRIADREYQAYLEAGE